MNVQKPSAGQKVGRRIRQATQGRSGDWIVRATRLGYGTRAVVFTLVGMTAVRAAIGIGGTAGTHEVIRALGHQPFGKWLLVLTTIGLTSYVLWRFLQAALDPVKGGSGTESSLRRLGFFGSGIFYALLAVNAAQLAFDIEQIENARGRLVAWVLELPFGAWVISFVGLVLIGVGGHAWYRAATASFMELYPSERLRPGGRRRRLARRVGQLGLSALGSVLCLIGGFVIIAATESDPQWAVGIGGALDALSHGPYGALLVGVAGIGFIFYGVHCLVLGIYRRVRPVPGRAVS